MKRTAFVVLLFASACTRAAPIVDDASAPIIVDAGAAPSAPLAVDASSVIVDASIIDAGAADADAGHDPCARCKDGEYCLVVTKSGGVQRFPNSQPTVSFECLPLPPDCSSCVCLDTAGKCENKNGRIRKETMVLAP